jgi:hypothetical protein
MYETPDGTRLLLLPYGGRTLGLYSRESDDNFFWTNPFFEQAKTAKALFQSRGWHNSGGDRTWLAPELDIFFPNYPNTDIHFPPRQLDAGDYALTRTSTGLKMEKSMSIRVARLNQDVKMRLAKCMSPAANPLRHEGELKREMEALQFAGYTQRTYLEIIGPNSEAKLGLWNLLQLPHGGEILVPTYSRSEPRILFGNVAPKDLVVDDRLIRFKICRSGEYKISVRALASTGRAAYLYPTGKQWALVVRNFFVNPSGEYVDVPKDDIRDLGYAIQAVSVDSDLGSFCELEYHVPALDGDGHASCCEEESQVWAFRGSREAIRAVARRLLSSEV